MSLTREVVRAIAERGTASLDDIVSLYPDKTRRSVRKAIQNARRIGLLRLVRRGGEGFTGHGSKPGVYEITGPEALEPPKGRVYTKKEKPPKKTNPTEPPKPRKKLAPRPRPRVCSVWDLGSGPQVFALPGEATRTNSLGEW